jgi:hypothetical protein
VIIRLEPPFIETLKQLGQDFSGNDRQKLADIMNSKYDYIISTLKEQENSKKDFDPKVVELGEIDSRIFTLNLYKDKDQENADVPIEITQLLPTISPVRMDIMVTLHKQSNNGDSSYLKVGQLYDDGNIDSKYIDEIMEEE